MIELVVSVGLGIGFMLAAFFARGMRGAFSGGPLVPITRTGRVLIFTTGLVIFVHAIRLAITKS